MISVYELPVDTVTCEYELLSESAKIIARKEVLEFERIMYSKAISDTKKLNIHAKINDHNFIRKLLSKYRLIRKMEITEKVEKIIIGNICVFLEDGRYVVFMKKVMWEQ